MMLGWGLLLVASLAFVVISFDEIPFKTLDLMTYLLNIFQIFIFVVAFLVTYKIFVLGPSGPLGQRDPEANEHSRETNV